MTTMRRNNGLTAEMRESIKKLHALGIGTRRIAAYHGISRYLVSKVLREDEQ